VTRRPGGSDGPEDVDAAFAEIVASLEAEGLGALFESNLTRDDLGSERTTSEPTGPTGPTAEVARTDADRDDTDVAKPAGWRTPETEWDPDAVAEDEHFVPPDPPPLPRLRPGTVFGIVLLAIGVLLLAAPSVIGLDPRIATPLALVAMASGIGWLVLRMKQGPPPDSGWDDGAQL
jgi:hypothetical protein